MLSVGKYQKTIRASGCVVFVKVSIVFHSCFLRCFHVGFIALLSISAASDWPNKNVISPSLR